MNLRNALYPRRGAALAIVVGTLALFGGIVAGCHRAENSIAVAATPAPGGPPGISADCRRCHEAIFQSWSDSHHARAHRPVDAAIDAEAFTASPAFSLHGVDYRLGWQDGHPTFSEQRPGAAPERFTADFVLGYTPLRQFVVPVGNGRYQLTELAFDPARKDWFNVFADERRQPGEWGHWSGRGMNWNSMCAHCHFTGFHKNYDAQTDRYASSWREHGVGCAQCHSDLPANHAILKRDGAEPARGGSAVAAAALPAAMTPAQLSAIRQRQQESCAPCHARNELLSGEVKPGGRYTDNYRLTLPTDPAQFYPDGQMRDEVFNYTSLLTSRMGGKAGVTCLDCHDPHSGHTRLPAENNALCLQCHAAPGRQGAIAIEPLAHSHHAAGSTGNQCVSCHMPMTTYMQRDPRHDHGFLKPDPLLTKELGIPNACARCHTDQTVDWAIARTDEWYGAKMESRQRERTRAVAAAQAGAPDGATMLLAQLAGEEVPAWRATLLSLARSYGSEPRVLDAARRALTDADPLVRSTAVQLLGAVDSERAALTPLLRDPARLVRLDAAWLHSERLADNSPERKELDAYLASAADQPGGRVRIAQDLLNRGRAADAEPIVRLATQWDPNSGGVHEMLGLVLHALGRPAEAAGSLWRASQLSPHDAAVSFNAALAFAEARKLADAELALRETIRRAPRHDRAWYNLGLLLAQTGRADPALEAMQQAETIAPQVADYPYARATLLWQRGDRNGARVAAQQALRIDPAHAGARGLLQAAQ